MSGIISYYHGEQGVVTDRWWQPLNHTLAFCLELAGNPHRVRVRDYDADIGIDPAVSQGEAVTYLRLDDTCGIWTRACDQEGTALTAAIGRVRHNRRWIKSWEQRSRDRDAILNLAQELRHETGDPLRIVVGEPAGGGAETAASFFLSYCSSDCLLARQVYADLSNDAKVKVWFDLAQPSDVARDHDDAIAEWLAGSVRNCQGFVLLLTKNALDSNWVDREIDFALNRGIGGTDSHILILKAEDVAVPKEIQSVGKVIDCDGTWWSRGISEELFAAIYGREGRKRWLSRGPGNAVSEGEILRYSDFATEAGTVVSFSWTTSPLSSDFRAKDISWSLAYRQRSGEVNRVEGGGEDKPVDLDIRRGDRIAFLTLHRRWGIDLGRGLPLWMRSDALELTSDAVLDRYFEALQVNYDFAPTRTEMRRGGVDALGRATADVQLLGNDGRWRRYDDLAWTMLRQGLKPAELLGRFLVGVSA